MVVEGKTFCKPKITTNSKVGLLGDDSPHAKNQNECPIGGVVVSA